MEEGSLGAGAEEGLLEQAVCRNRGRCELLLGLGRGCGNGMEDGVFEERRTVDTSCAVRCRRLGMG